MARFWFGSRRDEQRPGRTSACLRRGLEAVVEGDDPTGWEIPMA